MEDKLLIKRLAFSLLLILVFVIGVEAKYKPRFEYLLNLDPEKADLRKIYDHKTKRIRYAKDEIIVKFKKDATEAQMKDYMLQNGLQPIQKIAMHTYTCRVMEGQMMDAQRISLLAFSGGVSLPNPSLPSDLVEAFDLDEYRKLGLNRRRGRRDTKKVKRIARTKTNLLTNQWHLCNDGQNGRKAGADVRAQEAWVYSRGSGVKVAVIDTGFDVRHPDINFIEGYDVVDHDSQPSAPAYSRENHGTAVAGIIAAKDDDIGVVGVAPSAEIIPIRLIPEGGYVSVSDIILAHHKAMELGADIINNSWTSYDPSLPEGQELELSELEKDLYRELAEEANDGRGILVIFASGNSGSSDLAQSPEARSPYTLAVGSTNSLDTRSYFSTYGQELDLVAPGGGENEGIYTTDRVDVAVKTKNGKRRRTILGYSKGATNPDFKGTSASAPVVSGVAALVWSANPSLTAGEVKQVLIETAEQLDGYEFFNNKNEELGYGRVNAFAAVKKAYQI